MQEIKSEIPGIQANLVFFYYPDLEEAEKFYANLLDFEKVLDYGFARIFRISPSTFIGLVDESKGLHRFTPEKAVNVCFLTDRIDDWFRHFQAKNAQIRNALEKMESIPVEVFVASDPGGYIIEFDRFLEDPKNRRIRDLLR